MIGDLVTGLEKNQEILSYVFAFGETLLKTEICFIIIRPSVVIINNK